MVKRMKRTKRIETDFDTPHPPLAMNTNSKVFFAASLLFFVTTTYTTSTTNGYRHNTTQSVVIQREALNRRVRRG